jgi:RNA polymerase sigma factor (sigma-70 family)
MSEENFLAERFEADRPRLRAVAYRMLGSLPEAEDAVQEAWLRLGRAGGDGIDNLSGWLTTVVARICLDQLRARRSRREELFGAPPEAVASQADGADPEMEAQLADSVGLALLVVLEKLAPAERLAFVLHDLFAVPFDEIASIVGRSEAASRQLASRARRRVQGATPAEAADRANRRKIVDAFLAASRAGDFEGLLALLDPDVVVRGDAAVMRLGAPAEIRGARAVAERYMGTAQSARTALVDGEIGVVVAPRGRLLLVLEVTVKAGRIAAIQAIGDRAHLESLDLAVLAD